VKEQTAEGSAPLAGRPAGPRALAIDWRLPQWWRRLLVPTLFVALALLVTTGYGSGVQLSDGQASLHIDPLKFLWQLLHAWNPSLYLGTHTGFWFPYETPYAWAYALAEVLHVPQELAQRVIVFTVYLACLASMYYCLRNVTPWLDEVARIAGSCAYLFNMYVALNSQAQVVWLLTYATLPALAGVTARAIRGEINLWRAVLATALLVLVGGGINPPLVAINVIVLAIFVLVMLALDPQPAAAAKRTVPFILAASVAAIAINLYWIVPFVDFFRNVWLNGVLSEAPSMHNAATSFDNVLRGLGHWATFVSFGGRPYFPWAAPYAAGLFSALLWLVPIIALGGIAFKRNQRPATLFFLLVTIVSVPIVVGYYHDGLGDAVTTPIYDAFYRNFPGFQMFRFSYKWIAGVEFGISGLYAIAVYGIVASLREYLSKLTAPQRWSWSWAPAAAATALIILPILVFVPVLINKMNYPGQAIPSWEYRQNPLVGNDQNHRVALLPTQFLEQFDWGDPQFYIEDSLVGRPMIYGLLGSEPSEGSDLWVRRAYRATREGLPFAADMFRALGVDTIEQRDDFIPAIDFSSPGEWRFNTTTLTHDLVHRVLGATPARADGPLHAYHLSGSLPLIYGVTHPVVSALPTFTDAYLGNVAAMAKGQAQFDPPTRSADEFSTAMEPLSPILPESTAQTRDLAVNQALAYGIQIHPPSADVSWSMPFEVKSDAVYAIFAREQSLLFNIASPQTVEIDGQFFSPQTTGGAWTQYGQIELAPGSHSVSDGYPDPNLIVALVRVDDLKAWEDRIAALARALPKNLTSSILVYAKKTNFTVPSSGKYRVRATAVGSFGPDGLVRTQLRRGSAYRSAFPTDLSGTLPYIPGNGVVATSTLMMPPQWYRDDPTAYQWQRGDPTAWLLFARNAHVRVYVPGNSAVRTAVTMRVSRLQISNLMTVAVNGRASQSVVLPGASANAQEYDSTEQLAGPMPGAVGFALTLRPGWNDVAFNFYSGGGERPDLGSGVISAAVAPDLAFNRIASQPGAQSPARDDAFKVVALADPPQGLAGDPEVVGSVARSAGRDVWLAVALAERGKVEYRVLPVNQTGGFDINFMHAFPDSWYDASKRVVGIWFISRGAAPAVSGLFYNLHAMPARAMRHPQSLANLPLRVDGRLIGTQPVFLSAGKHRIVSADREAKLGLLRVEPVGLPRTQPFALTWHRKSPTTLDVTARNTSNPFLLVFGEAYHPEWQATLNGEPLTHVVVDGFANGWIVPSLPSGGKISLTFTAQRYYLIAGIISLISLIILIALASVPELWPIRTSNH
jgi:hypothetical protein